jgi:hypothetical protein
MLTDFQKTELWEKWLASEMRANYYADLCARFQRRHNVLTWMTLLFSSGAALSFLTRVPDWGKASFAIVAAGVSFYAIVQQSLRKISECSDLSFRWNSLAIQYQELWNAVDADDAGETLRMLMQKGAEISKGGHSLPNDQKTMLKWEEHEKQCC